MSLPRAYEPHPWCPMLEHFERSKASKIHNGIMFDFYLGLPHVPYYNDTCTADTPIVYYLSYIQAIRTWRVKRPRTRVIMKGACSQFVYMDILCTCTKEGGWAVFTRVPMHILQWLDALESFHSVKWIMYNQATSFHSSSPNNTHWTCQCKEKVSMATLAMCVYAKPPCDNLQ